jgi:NAD(P)-dependent dehydrogenase (short-subunit alcohol dehydrogenase family)
MSDLTFDFTGRAAIVTGAGKGIGRAVALALGAAGAAVVCGDINPDSADETAQDIVQAGGRALAYQMDVSNRFQASALIETGRETYGRIHMLVNAAGVYKRGEYLKFDEWDWRRVLDVNITGTFFCMQLLSRVMAEEGGGVIINIASDAGYPNPISEGVSYAASKVGIIGMTIQAAQEMRGTGVRIHAVCPSDVDEGDGTPTRSTQPLSPDAIAPLLLFLCSDAAGALNGRVWGIGS